MQTMWLEQLYIYRVRGVYRASIIIISGAFSVVEAELSKRSESSSCGIGELSQRSDSSSYGTGELSKPLESSSFGGAELFSGVFWWNFVFGVWE